MKPFYKSFTVNSQQVLVMKDCIEDEEDVMLLIPVVKILVENDPLQGVDILNMEFETFEKRDTYFEDYSPEQAQHDLQVLRDCVLDLIPDDPGGKSDV